VPGRRRGRPPPASSGAGTLVAPRSGDLAEGVTAVWYRVRRLLRAEWRADLAFVLVVAVVGAMVLTLAAGARRTSSAPERYERTFAADYDVALEQNHGTPLTDGSAAISSVRGVP